MFEYAMEDDSKYATAKELGLMEGFPPASDKRVNKTNALLTAPYNRWSYLNMREIYPSAPIKASEQPTELKFEPDKGISNIKIENPDTRKLESLDTFLKTTYTDAMLVIKGNRIIYEHYDNGMTGNHPHQMMSVTKSFCGLLGLMAVEDGKIKEEDLVTDYIPELEDSSAFSEATFHQVLDMTNSMSFSEAYSDPKSGVRIYGAIIGWTEKDESIKYKDSLYEYLPTLTCNKDYEHGEIFDYHTPKTDVINWVINRLYKNSFQELMYQKLWSKLGTEGETYVLLDENSTLIASGGLNATPYNLARFGIMMINNGKFNGEQVVPVSVIEKITNGGDINAFDNGSESHEKIHPKGEWSYRAQWWVKHTKEKQAFMAIGIHGQWIYFDIKNSIAIIKQSSQPVSKDDFLNGFDLNALYAISHYLKT